MTERFIPERTFEGGTLVGTSYTNEFASCPYSWFNSYLRPHPDGTYPAEELKVGIGAGIRARFTSPLLLAGRVFHIGIASWYESGVHGGEDTGERNIELAVAAARSSHESALHEYQDKDHAADDWTKVEVMLRNYHDEYGPGGKKPEFPELQVVCDGEGKPLVEREFPIRLGLLDYVLTSRPDLIITLRGLLRTRDHKTCSPSFGGMWVRKRKEWTYWDPQFKGELLCLNTLFPHDPIDRAEANIVIKDRKPGSNFQVAERESVDCTFEDLLAYRLELIDILKQIDERVGRYRLIVTQGQDPEHAAWVCFPRHGTRTGHCTEYLGCPYQSLCLHKDRTDEAMRHFRPREIVDRNEAQGRPY